MGKLDGQKLGKYDLVERMAQGGMAEVYKAFQPGVERTVVLKVLHGHLVDNQDIVARFQREARLADAARPKDTEDRKGQLRFAEGSTQPVALTDAADKLPPPGLFQPLLQRITGHRLVLGVPSL